VVSVDRLLARARLDDSPAALARAKAQAAEGDESWEQWVAEYQRGEALIVRLELMMEISDGASHVINATKEGLFIENHVHAPRVEKQIAELASGDFAALGAELVSRGHEVDQYELGELYVHVELDKELRLRLSRPHG
jgi:hypothetical protein